MRHVFEIVGNQRPELDDLLLSSHEIPRSHPDLRKVGGIDAEILLRQERSETTETKFVIAVTA
jgi:hypothetical protein